MAIIQEVKDRYLVYVRNHRNDWKDVAREFGMVNDSGPLSTTFIHENDSYMNTNGVLMPCTTLNGRTVNLSVVDDTVSGGVETGQDIAALLNYFPKASFNLGGVDFVGKFRARKRSVADELNRGLGIGTEMLPDMAGIMGMMHTLSADNGDMYRPVVARFVYASREMPKGMKAIGYFDLREYYRLIRSDAAGMFARESESSQMDVVLDMPRSGRLTARIASSQSGKCKLALSGFPRAIPVGNVGAKAVVVLSLTPLKIRQMTFPVQKMKFDHTWVFMTPMMMNDMGAWESLQGGLNLLKPTMR